VVGVRNETAVREHLGVSRRNVNLSLITENVDADCLLRISLFSAQIASSGKVLGCAKDPQMIVE
jgi:hypothetical protein